MYNENINNSIGYINKNLSTIINVDQLAASIGFSTSHFSKIFYKKTGFTVNEYIRNKRLSFAARELIANNKSINEISSIVGFNSSEVFIRAFKKLYKMNPTEYKKKRNDLIYYDKVASFAKMASRKIYNYSDIVDLNISTKIISKEEIYLVGLQLETSLHKGLIDNVVENYWENNFSPRILEIESVKNYFVSIRLFNHDPDIDKLYNFVCVEVSNPEITLPKGMFLKIIPESKYAVFSTERPIEHNSKDYTSLIQYVFGDWLPLTGNERRFDFNLDIYTSNDYFPNITSVGSKYELWVPIK